MKNKVTYSVSEKVMDRELLRKQLGVWRLKDDVIVFTNGCFDLLHQGHILYLQEAAHLGHRLVVGLNSDSSIQRLKGENRPVNPESSRSLLMAALHFVDAVILFDEDTPAGLIEWVRPDILVKGADYKEDEVVGGDFVKSYGGSVRLIEFVPGYSSSGIIEKIKNS